MLGNSGVVAPTIPIFLPPVVVTTLYGAAVYRPIALLKNLNINALDTARDFVWLAVIQ